MSFDKETKSGYNTGWVAHCVAPQWFHRDGALVQMGGQFTMGCDLVNAPTKDFVASGFSSGQCHVSI